MKPKKWEPLVLSDTDQKTVFFSNATFLVGLIIPYYFQMPDYVYWIWAASFVAVIVLFRSMHAMAMYYRCVMPIIIGILFVMFYNQSHQSAFLKAFYLDIPHSDFHGENFYAVISTLYALITALVLIKGIETFDKLNAAINDEANKIQSVMEFLDYFIDPQNPDAKRIIANIKQVFLVYAGNVLEQQTVAGSQENQKSLRRCAKEVSRLRCRDENDRIALAEVMNGLNDLGSIRTRRINCAIAKIPVYLIVATGIMSLGIILPFFRENPDIFNQNHIMIFLMSSFSSFLLIMLTDINSPFEGFWRVDTGVFAELRRSIISDINGN